MKFDEKPTDFPEAQVDGSPLKPITRVLLDRRATIHFKPTPVPQQYLEAILRFAAQAPSGYNLQPWRFIVVQKEENRKRLQKAAKDQPKVGEAPVVIIAFGIKGEPQKCARAVFEEGVRRNSVKGGKVDDLVKVVDDFLATIPSEVWLSRHTMIAVTTMMLVAEAYGLDTAPMEGFDPEAVKREFDLPAEAEVVALLAMGFAQEPDKPYGGRFALKDLAYRESFQIPWNGK